MKKVLAYSFIVIILVGGVLADFGHVKKVSADPRCPGNGPGYDDGIGGVICTSVDPITNEEKIELGGTLGNQVKAASSTSACGWIDSIANPVRCLLPTLSYTVLNLMALFLWLAAALFDFVIQYTVVDISQNIKNITGINIAWSVLRDLANMGFIFLLLYSAIKLIIGLSDEGEVKKTITGVILIALILNFSLFFTKIVIDATNVVTLGFYSSINSAGANISPDSSLGSGTGGLEVGERTTGRGIAGAFMRPLGLVNLFSNESFESFTKEKLQTGIIIIGLAGSVLFLITGFIFFAAAILFISRFVILIMLMILSPLAFVAYAFPNTRGKFSEWWGHLINQAIFPVVFMILVWVALNIFSSPDFLKLTDSASWGDVLFGKDGGPPSAGAIQLLFNFAIVIGFMIFALVVSKGIAQKSGAFAGKVISGIGTAGFGTAAWAGRSTLGRAGKAVADNEWLKEKAKTSRLASLTLKAGDKTAQSSFDVRAARVAQGVGVNQDFGKTTGKGGYEKTLKDQVKQREEFAKTLQPTGAKLGQKLAPKDAELEKTRKSISDIDREIAAKKKDIATSGLLGSTTEKKRELAELEASRSALVSTQKGLDTDIKNIKNIGKERQLAYSNVLESGLFGLRKANQEGAAAVRKLAKEDKKNNAKKAIKDYFGDEEKEGDEEPKPETESSSDDKVA